MLPRMCPHRRFDVASNPECLREGSAIEDFMPPDRVVIGTTSERAKAVMRRLYWPLYLIETLMLFTDIETAELIKYAANPLLATKITFINQIAHLCERVGADVQDVAKGIGLDVRIDQKFLMPGRALATHASLRTAKRWCAPPARPKRGFRSSRPCCRSMRCVSFASATRSSRPWVAPLGQNARGFGPHVQAPY